MWRRRRQYTFVTRTGAFVVGAMLVALPAAGLAGQPDAGASSAVRGATVDAVTYHTAATLTGPITTGHVVEPISAHPLELAASGYVEQEFFASGTATAFKGESMPSNGDWSITPTTSASYETRILVRRPADPARFNGTVVVEWMNVTVAESAVDWDFLNPMLMRDGYAYVGVSAQSLAIDGGRALVGGPSGAGGGGGGLVAAEPARYGSLHHPGDQYALDIFAQIGNALRAPNQAALGGLHPKHIIATGESQSAANLTTFADAVQPLTHTFDGIFIHSRFGSSASLSGALFGYRHDLRIRTDLKIPVFMFETQTDVIEFGYAGAQQPNTRLIRTWEVAGTAHGDAYQLGSASASSVLGCTAPINDGPQHPVAEAAFVAFTKWVVEGTPPPTPAPFRLTSIHPPTLALDSHGNVIGGVRTPAVDVPISTLSGHAPKGTSVICSFFGSSTAFGQAELVSLYHTRSGYLAAYRASLNKAIAMGYVLGADRAALLAQAEQVQIP
jgi:Alpha/beta hydrolase domain